MRLLCILLLSCFYYPAFPKDSLVFEKWTPGFEVPDPVAISFDPEGRAYVTQTRRRKAQDLDIRRNLDWVIQDISAQSIEEKESFYRGKFTPENSKANRNRVADYNKDGVHDIKDLQALSERIHLVVDTDGDGLADKASIFAEEMKDILTGVAGGVLYHRGDVFACPVPGLIKFRDTDRDGKADTRESLVRGFGVKIAYAGHDMHGLRVGTDGRIYWTVGDKGLSVTSQEGLKFHYPNQGALMRCEPDGSNFEVYAHGLRNIQEIAFDQYGNFFGVDNDSDGKGERERFVHVEQYSDAGWRCNWQYRKGDYNPWMDEDMHIPYFAGQPAWFTPPRSNYENGPAGFTYNPGTALSEKYEDHFFLTSAPRGQQWAFRVKEDGDSFKMVNDRQIGRGVALVGLSFGPDGGLYGVDWGATGYPLNQKGGVWRIDVPDAEKHPLREKTRKLIAADFSKLETADLVQHFSNPDQRVRLQAQFELVDRKEVATLGKIASLSEGMGQLHGIWGLGQLGRRGVDVEKIVLDLLDHENPEVQMQVLRTVTDCYGTRLGLHIIPPPKNRLASFSNRITPLLKSQSKRVQVQALLALARIGDIESTESIEEFLNGKDRALSETMLRHAGVMALAGCVPTEKLLPGAEDTRFFQICKIVALRKRGDPAVSEYVGSEDPVVAAEAAQAIYGDWMIPAAMPALARSLGNHPGNEAFTRRAIAANLRGGTLEDATRLVKFLHSNPAQSDAALRALEQWAKPNVLDPVEGRYRPLENRNSDPLKAALLSGLNELLKSESSSIASRSMKLATGLKIPLSAESLLAIAKNPNLTSDLKISALQGLKAQGYQGILALAGSYLGKSPEDLQKASLEVIAELDPARALAEVEKLVQGKGPSIPLQQFAISMLPAINGEGLLKTLWDSVREGKANPAVALDIIETARMVSSLSDSVTQYESVLTTKSATEPLAPFSYTTTGGDPNRGKQVFEHHVAAQCLRCHKVKKGKGSDVGPVLAGIGKKRGVDHLLESLILPQAEVSEGYGTISLTLKDGSVVMGQYREEKKNEVVIRTPEEKTVKVKTGDIKERSPVISTMPPMGFILKKKEIRDMIAYLMSI